MIRLVPGVLLAFALASGAAVITREAEASERPIGKIVSTNAASKNNSNTAAPFTIRASTNTGVIKAVVQCDQAAYVASAGCTSSSCAATADDTNVAAGKLYDVDLVSSENHIATLCVAATSCTCIVRNKYP
jgi:hypothetical protein